LVSHTSYSRAEKNSKIIEIGQSKLERLLKLIKFLQTLKLTQSNRKREKREIKEGKKDRERMGVKDLINQFKRWVRAGKSH
jgi:hypothetical protein